MSEIDHTKRLSVEAVRNFRGVRYEVSALREGPGNDISLEVDGQPIEGTVIPLPKEVNITLKIKAVIR